MKTKLKYKIIQKEWNPEKEFIKDSPAAAFPVSFKDGAFRLAEVQKKGKTYRLVIYENPELVLKAKLQYRVDVNQDKKKPIDITNYAAKSLLTLSFLDIYYIDHLLSDLQVEKLQGVL